jgi:DsbC/DsbD-like thiol-disulfide interchange protein
VMNAIHLVGLLLVAQTLALKPSTVQHVTAAPAVTRSADGRLTLALDVTPNSGIHVYAPGAKDFIPVSLILTPQAGVTTGKPVYPKADPVSVVGADDTPMYQKTFRITQPVTVNVTNGQALVIAGVLNYQACDDRLCYPSASLPVTWTIKP